MLSWIKRNIIHSESDDDDEYDQDKQLIHKLFSKEEIYVGQHSSIEIPFMKNGDIIYYASIGSAYKSEPYLAVHYTQPDTGKDVSVSYGAEFYYKNFDYIIEKLNLLRDQIRFEIKDRKERKQNKVDYNKLFQERIKDLS